MAWTIKLSKEAQSELEKLDKPVREKIIAFLDRIQLYPSPRSIGKALKGQWSGRWRYSVRLQDDVLVVEVIKIGHRREVYGT